jgi:hypothetical protein
MQAFAALSTQYQLEEKRYEKKKAAMSKISKQIHTTIHRNNVLLILKCETLYQTLTALKQRLAPTDRAEQLDLIR